MPDAVNAPLQHPAARPLTLHERIPLSPCWSWWLL